jgi:hypothetical protein
MSERYTAINSLPPVYAPVISCLVEVCNTQEPIELPKSKFHACANNLFLNAARKISALELRAS